MAFCRFTLNTLLLFITRLIFSNSKSITLNPHLLNNDSGNREKFTIKVFPSKDEEETFNDPLKALIAQRFRRSAAASGKIDPKQYSFHDSHNIAEVHWSGKNSSAIMVLMKDPSSTTRSMHPSSFWVSRNYGINFTDISSNFTLPNGTHSTITEFFGSKADNKNYILVDKFNKYIFTSSDECRTFLRVKVYFHPTEIKYHPKYHNYVLAYEKDMGTKQLYSSTNNGRTWRYKSANVKSYYWGYSENYYKYSTYIYYLRRNWYGYSNIVKKSSPWGYYYSSSLAYNVEDFQLVNQYMFVTKNNSYPGTKDLYVSYMRGSFQNTSFPFKNYSTSFIIADASENETLVAANHNGTSNLYISNTEGTKYTLSLENILYYNEDDGKRSYFRHDFVDLHRIQGISGIYIATQLVGNKPGKRHLQSMITFDKGGYWSLMTAPSDHKNCSIWYHCSLHLSQEFGYHNPLLHFSPILSKPSAPGFVIGTGNVGETLKSSPNVYFSKDAGLSWKKLFSGHYYYNFLDHGGIIVAVQKYGLIEALQYSIDEGETWHGLKFTKGKSERVRVYGILTEPGEKTTVFTIYASYPKTHSWEVIQVDMKPVLGKKCSSSDYAEWIVTDQRNDTEKCVLGKKQKFERRKAKAICYNGRNYDRPIQVAPCLCVREDFECDFGFKEQMVGWFDWECVHDSDFEDYSKKPPSWCKAGLTYNISSGYVKVPGDACYGGEEEKYEPTFKMCPIKKPDDFLLYAVRKSFYGYDFKLKDSIEFKIDGYANIVSLEYAYEKGILFFGDKDRDEIVMINTKNGNISKLLHFDSTSTHIESMAYDWIGDNLYYCDSGRAEIGVINVFGKHRPRKDLISSGDLDKPRALIVHPTKGYMFWTDWGIKPKIARATMDGNNIKEIITTTLHWPNGLTIDYDSNTLYFADAYQDRIEKCDLNGENRHVLRSLGIYHPYALTFYKGELYWDDSNVHSIFKVDKSGNNKQTVVSYLSYAMDIKAFSPERQKQGTNGCIGSDKKSKCSFICLPSEDNKHTCTCPQNLKVVKNGDAVSCKCPGTNEILSDGECKAVNKTKCLPTQFGCLNGECIPSHWKCDDEKDCSDGSDESTGLCSTCYSDQFKCNDGRCVLSSYKCDGEYDCVDKSDELYCPTATPTTPCSSGMVSCPDGSRCIMSSWFCDGEMDCDDNSDENIAYCKNKTIPTTVPTTYKPCLKTEFQCVSTGRCISEDWRCDDIEDCIDLSDELNCKNETCGTNQFKCSNDNLCVPNSVKCDHHNDCPDASDELNCDWTTGKPYVTKVLRCDDDHKYCADNTECYAKEGRCDGSYDCRDKSDEKDCPKRSTERPFCPKRQLCSSGRCINEYQVCDGRQDCPRGEDELNCKDEQCLPKPFGFNCTKNLKSECHLNNILCDGQFDCDDNSDEPPAICNVTKRVLNVNAKFVQPMDDGDLSVQISWTVPDVKISDAQSFIVKYIDDQHHVYSKKDLPLHPAYIKIPNIKPCRKYVFAVALRHTQLKLHQNLFTSTAEMESPGRRKPTAPVLRSSHDNQISWEQDKGDCMDHYEVQEAKLQCHEYGSSAFVDLSLEGNILFDASRKILGTGPNTNSRKFNCSIVVLYMNKKSGDIIPLQSEPFDFPDNSQTGKHTQGHKKRNTLVWAIPVALVVIALVVGLLLMGYKYRRLQNSFLAFAARGGYNRQVDDYDDDDDNMAVNFRTGEDAPMINRFSDDEPLVVG